MKFTEVKLVRVFADQGEPIDVMSVEKRDAWNVMEAISKIRCEGLEHIMAARFWSFSHSHEWNQEIEDSVLKEWKTDFGNFKKVNDDLAWIQYHTNDYIFVLGDECTWFNIIEKYDTWEQDAQEMFLQYCSVILKGN